MTLICTKKVVKEKYNLCPISQYNRIKEGMNLLERPETYQTILENEYGNNSRTISTKRKINQLRKGRLIYDEDIASINGRQKIFFVFEKNYFIVVGNLNTYYCDKIKSKGGKLYLTNCYKLNCSSWEFQNNIEIHCNEVKKCF